MTIEKLSFVSRIKQENVIDMALAFTAMIRLFEKGSKRKIARKLFEELQRLDEITSFAEFQALHMGFCYWFMSNIKTVQRIRNNKIVKKSKFTTYGHAAKLLDVTLKVYVYYSGLPDLNTAKTIMPFINAAIDNPLLKYLKRSFPNENVFANTVEQIDESTYKKLQELIRVDIYEKFNNEILPTQYDDIMWHRFKFGKTEVE